MRFSVFVSNSAFTGLRLPAPMARDGVFASMYISEKFTMLPTCVRLLMFGFLRINVTQSPSIAIAAV